jgi:hypothetical protein
MHIMPFYFFVAAGCNFKQYQAENGSDYQPQPGKLGIELEDLQKIKNFKDYQADKKSTSRVN